MISDFLLVRKMKQGDEASFEVFVHKYYHEILLYCRSHCFDRFVAEDLTQETFARFFSKLPHYQHRAKAQNYLYTIAANLCKDFYKKAKAIPMEDPEGKISAKADERREDQPESVLAKLALEQALRKLPEELYQVISLYCISPSQEKIQETIRISKKSFWNAQEKTMISYREFLWIQFQVVQKRWWCIQLLVLCLLAVFLRAGYEDPYVQREMGVMASLFVILIVPELWKSRSYHSMEVEEVSYFSLRHIYAARMVLFGLADLLMLTVLGGLMTLGMGLDLWPLFTQFLFPMMVTACICFGTLSSKRAFGETTAIAFSILWSVIWSLILMNEQLYGSITIPIWIGLLVLSCCCFGGIIYRILYSCGNYWEVEKWN